MFKRLRVSLTHPFLLAAASAALLRLAYPTLDLWITAWFGLLPLLAATARQKPQQAFGTAFFAGFLFFLATLYWVVHVTAAGAVVLSFYCALYFGLFGLAFRLARGWFSSWLVRSLWSAAFWVLLEYLRGHLFSGFPWALLAYSQTENLLAIQVADLIGAYGVSFLLVFVNVAFFEMLERRADPPVLALRRAGVVVAVIAAWLGYGAARLYQDPLLSSPLSVAVVQANIAQEIKWVPRFSPNISEIYAQLTSLAELRDDPDVVVWPETSVPDYLEIGVNDGPLRDLARQGGRPLFVGAVRMDGFDYFNSALLYLPSGRPPRVYDKLHLVPFGEFLPGRTRVPFLAKLVPIEDFTRGRRITIFPLYGKRCPRIRAGVLICFEDIFPDLASAFVVRGADFLINMTNDGWFKDTASPYQHYQASVFRAVENRVYVVRAANTGISCIIDDTGRRVARVEDASGKPTFVMGTAAGFVYRTARRAVYTYFGALFVGCVLVAVLAGLFVGVRKRRAGE
ncbi:MAG: apolipoprotein N-acyltransferase [Deltaproteobacteria bacterium]